MFGWFTADEFAVQDPAKPLHHTCGFVMTASRPALMAKTSSCPLTIVSSLIEETGKMR